jgi:RNA polymerase sigma factor (sigma-70 family)
MKAISGLIEHIRKAVPPDDGELLGRFVESRDERALATLVERHGPMVWGVCRRLLGHHDAEDAFQATFIVLVRKAASVNPRGKVGNWLYGVARQAALQARAARPKEVQVMEMPDVEAPQDQWADLHPLLDEELGRLPDYYRAVIVLSDLEGKGRKEVAAHLGCPEGTVASRLVRARAMLAKRLTKRGVALSGGALAAALSRNVASAGVPTSVVMSTIKAANLGQVPVKVAALAEGVLKTMLLTKLKSVMAILVVVAMVGLVGYGVARGQQKGDVPQNQASAKKAEDAALKEKPAKKETIAWGNEVDGLQMGLEGAQAVQQGKTARFAVKLRNVSNAEVTVTHGLLRESPPQVTTADGGKVSVFMPLPFDNYAPPTTRVIKPGETITLYAPEVAVESEARAQMDGEMRVGTPTICVAPGKYKIAYGGMIQSHPKLTTGTVEFEVKDQVAWGKAAGGLQAGIVGPSSARIGERARFAVKLRNVGKETIKVSVWPLWMCYPGVVDTKGNKVPTTTAPAPDFEIIPKALTLKPGETVDVGRSGPLVAESDQKVTVPDGVVDFCAIHVTPGMYTAGCMGFLKENHTLATATVEFEVKPASDTAWGKEVGGLQAGLSIAEKRVYHTGESASLAVRVRNVGKEEITFQYLHQFFIEQPPDVTKDRGESVKLPGITAFGRHVPVEVRLAPGKEIELYELKLQLKPAGSSNAPSTLYGTGKFVVQYPQVFGSSSSGSIKLDPALSRLATGKLELEVKEADDKKPTVEKPVGPAAKQEKEKETFTVWGKEVDGLQAGMGFRPGEKRPHHHGEEAWIVLRLRNIGKAPVEFSHIWAFFVENPPTITDADGKILQLPKLAAEGLQGPRDTPVAPGKEVVLYEWDCGLQPIGGISKNLFTIHGTGKFTLQCTRIVGPTTGNPNHPNPTLDKLATGKLELEIKSAPPAEKK